MLCTMDGYEVLLTIFIHINFPLFGIISLSVIDRPK
nr:MAG TPA: hypothetical protein [Caudoviricetes sp.]